MKKRIKTLKAQCQGRKDNTKTLFEKIRNQGTEIKRLKGHLETVRRQKLQIQRKAQENKLGGEKHTHRLCEQMKTLKADLTAERQTVTALENELQVHTHDKLETQIGSSQNSCYTTDVRKCCYHLLNRGVGINHVGPVIEYVAETLCHKQIGNLPKSSQMAVMQREVGQLAKIQTVDALQEDIHTTIHTDGTTKNGRHYNGIQITTSTGQLSLGMSEIPSGTSESYYQSVMTEFEECSRLKSLQTGSNEADITNHMLVNCKNTMSDKHVVESKMIDMIQKRRTEALPEVVPGWEDMSEAQQENLSSLNRFHCGLHSLVNAATAAEDTIKRWEKENTVTSPNWTHRGASITMGHIKAMCNLFHKDGGGAPGEIQLFLAENSLYKKYPIVPFSGSRFNILFHNGAGVYVVRETVKKFITSVISNRNRLHVAIMQDIDNVFVRAACRCLGLIDKFFSARLWRCIEDKSTTIIDASQHYTEVHEKLKAWGNDSSVVMDGTAVLVTGQVSGTDKVTEDLLRSDPDTDDLTKALLEKVFSDLVPKWEKWFFEHLPGGKYHTPTEEVKLAAANVPKTNNVSERDFAQLDRLQRISPNGNLNFLQSKIATQNNKTVTWLDGKDSEEQQKLVAGVRTDTRKRLKLEVINKEKMAESKRQLQRQKVQAAVRKDQRNHQMKEKLLQQLQKAGGLWTSPQLMESELLKLPPAQRKNAIKLQISARKRLVGQVHSDSSLFNFTCKKEKFAVEKLKQNLLKLMENTSDGEAQEESTSDLVQKIRMSPSLLIQREVNHYYDDEGEESWWEGKIVKQKKKTTMFVFQYKGDKQLYELDLDDILHDIGTGDLVFL